MKDVNFGRVRPTYQRRPAVWGVRTHDGTPGVPLTSKMSLVVHKNSKEEAHGHEEEDTAVASWRCDMTVSPIHGNIIRTNMEKIGRVSSCPGSRGGSLHLPCPETESRALMIIFCAPAREEGHSTCIVRRLTLEPYTSERSFF